MTFPCSNNANYILRSLEQEGLNYFFMIPGKLINPIMSCYNKNASSSYRIKPIVAAHEAGATAMADGYARATGHLGACIVIDGPGTANAIPMLASAQADKSSVLLIAGQIPRDFQGVGAIQDTTASGISTVDMLKPVCNKSIEISHSTALPRFLKSTIRNITGFEKGTGYLSISKDVLLEEAKEPLQRSTKTYDNPNIIDRNACDKFIDNTLQAGHKIMILVGAHCGSAIYPYLKKFSEKYSIPVATTINSKGLFDEEHQNFAGIYGYSGHERALKTVLSQESDLILLLGYDSTQWTTLAWHKDFVTHKNLVHIAANPKLLAEYLEVAEGIVSEPETFLKYLDKKASTQLTEGVADRKIWLEQIRQIPLYSQDLSDAHNADLIHPALIVKEARSVFPTDTIAVADAGVHRSYATHYWKTYGSNQFFAATKYAPMGWAVPASIGIKLAMPPQQRVVTFTGDGCMLMSGLEIQTAAKLNLDITFVVFNNGFYGASYFNNLENEEYLTKIPIHNWAMIAEGLGVKGFRVTKFKQLKEIYQKALQHPGPKLIDVICDHNARAPSKLYADTLKTHPFM